MTLRYKQVRSVAIDWHNYGNTAIGNRSDVENVPIKNLQAFYKTYYQPDNAVVTLVGNFDEAKALQLIADSYGKVRRPWRSLTIRRVGDVQYLLAAYQVPSVRHPDRRPCRCLTSC